MARARPAPVSGRTATYVVAANNAPAHVKAQADYICDGTADNVQIQAAIDALPSSGGRVVLSEGDFNTTSPITISGGASGAPAGKELYAPAGSRIIYVGSDAAVILTGMSHKLIAQEITSTGTYVIRYHDLQYSLIDIEALGMPSGTRTALIAFTPTSGVNEYSGNNVWRIRRLETGGVSYGVLLNSHATRKLEGDRFDVPVIFSAAAEGIRIGTNTSQQTVRWNRFYLGIDPQDITPRLINVYNNANFIVLENWAVVGGAGTEEVLFQASTNSNRLIAGAGTAATLRVTDDGNNLADYVLGTAREQAISSIPAFLGSINVKSKNDPSGGVRLALHSGELAFEALERATHIGDAGVPEDYGFMYIYNDGAGTTQLVVKLKVGGVVKTGTVALA